MRTTVELPADLMRAAKARAAQQGESLKSLLTRAVTREIRFHGHPGGPTRVNLPLVGHKAQPQAMVTNADIEDALAAEDAERYGSR